MSDSGLNHRLLTILAADATAYSRLMEADDRATVAALDSARVIFRTQIECNRGRVIDMAGDSVLAAFETASGAVSAALEIQTQLNAQMADVAEDRRMRFRIGIHLGEVLEKADGTVYGDGVNIAARLQALAEPGGITASEVIRIVVKHKVSAEFDDQGEQAVKNIANLVRAFRVRPAEGQALRHRTSGVRSASKTQTPEVSAPATVNWPGLRKGFNAIELVGRDDEVTKLTRLLTESNGSKRALVTGPPGMGKSVLTRAAFSDPKTKAFFDNRRAFVSLENAKDAPALVRCLIKALNLPPTASLDAITAELERAPTLLVLDNLETPLELQEGRGDVVSVLYQLVSVKDISVLASSQLNLAFPGIDWCRINLSPLNESDSESLFLRIANSISPEDRHLQQLLIELSGLPLAIELVATVAKGQANLDVTWDRWKKKEGTSLAAHPADTGGRLYSLNRSFQLALESPWIDAAGQRLLSLLGQLSGGMANEDTDALLGSVGGDAAHQLVRANLANYVVNDPTRVDVLPIVRRYARDYCHPSEKDERRWRHHYLQLVRDLGTKVQRVGSYNALARLGSEISNIEAAIDAAISKNLIEECDSKLLNSYRRLLSATGQGSSELFAKIAALYGPSRNSQRAFALWCYGNVIFRRSNFAVAREAYQRALELYDPACAKSLAHCLRNLADCELARGNHKEANKRFNEALLKFTNLTEDKDPIGVANCFRGQGDTAMECKDFERAHDCYLNAMTVFKDVRYCDYVGQGNCLLGLAEISVQSENFDAAEEYLVLAKEMYRSSGAPLGEANCVRGFGDVASARGQFEIALEQYVKAIDMYRKIGNDVGHATCLVSMGDLHRLKGESSQARDSYLKALAIFDEVGDFSRVGQSYWRLGQISSNPDDRNSYLKKARVAWSEIERDDLIVLLDSPDEEKVSTYRNRVA